MAVTRLPAAAWRPLEEAHHARIDGLTAGHVARRKRGEKHPVIDFLFDYYGQTPGLLRRWHPGAGVVLEEAAGEPRAQWKFHVADTRSGDVWVDAAAFTEARASGIGFADAVMRRTLARPVHTGCFGLHEWAMVYRRPAERRHERWPLRLGEAETDAVLEGSTLKCSHFDATRFFTPEGAARNTLAPSRGTMLDFEQSGCLHAGMDLYRWAFKLAPAMPSALITDAFELALRIRTLDMQASPYDLRELGYDPVAIETDEGRREYMDRQRAFATEANALRRRLLSAIAAIRDTVAAATV